MAFGLNIAKIIKYEGPADVLVWKHPAEDFNTSSQLIVHESQEAILFKDGQALDLFKAGRHTLTTENIPLLRRIISIPTNGETPFHCEVYFINKADILDVLWGTSQPMPIQDPIYHIILPVRANGQFALHVENSRKLLLKLVGTTSDMRKERVAALFKGMLITRAKNLIADRMTAMRISFLEIHSHLNEISDTIREQMAPMYEEYGMEVVNFFVNSISVPADDPGYMKIRTALAAAKEKELLAQGTRAEMDILGYSYQEKRTFDVLDRAAQNEGAGAGILGASMGMGMGVNMGSMIGGAMGSAMGNVMPLGQANRQQQAPDQVYQQPQQAPDQVYRQPPQQASNQVYQQTQQAPDQMPRQTSNQENQQMQGRTCKQCKTDLPAGAKFCFRCGKALDVVCPDCGNMLSGDAKFCDQCGRELTDMRKGEEIK